MSVIIRLQNLPWSATSVDIRQFFKGMSIPEGGVHIVGGDLGDTFIAFSSDEDARQAMQLTGKPLKGAAATLLLSSRVEMQKVIETARNPNQVVTVDLEKPVPIKTVSKEVDPKDSDGRDTSRTHSRDRDRDRISKDRDRSSRERDRDRLSRERDRDRYSSRSRRERSRSRSRTSRDRKDTDRRGDRRSDRSRRDGERRRSPESHGDYRRQERERESDVKDNSSRSNKLATNDWPNQHDKNWPPKETNSNYFDNMQPVTSAIGSNRDTPGLSRDTSRPSRDSMGPSRDSMGSIRDSLAPSRENVGSIRDSLGQSRESMGSIRDSFGSSRETMGSIIRDSLGPSRENMGSIRDNIGGHIRDDVGPIRGNVGPMRDNIGPIRDNIEGIRNNIGSIRDNIGPIRDDMGPMRVNMGSMRDDTGPMRDDTGPIRDNMGLMRDNMGLMRDTKGPMDDNIRSIRDNIVPMRENMGPIRESIGSMRESVGPMRESLGVMRDNMGPMRNNMGSVNDHLNAENSNSRWMENQNNFQGSQDQSFGNFSNNTSQSYGSMSSQQSNQTGRVAEPVQNIQPSYYVQVRGFQINANHIDVKDFFRGIFIPSDGVVFISGNNFLRGRSTSTAYVRFTSANDHGEALQRNKTTFCGSLIEVYVAQERDFVNAGGAVGDMRGFQMTEESSVILMKGLPYQCQNINIFNFFRDLQIVNIVLVHDRNDCFIGESFVEFDSHVDAKKALTYTRNKMGPCTVDVVMSSKAQMMEVAPKSAQDPISKPSMFSVLMQGLPFNASDRDIIEFFSEGGISPVAIHILLTGNGMATGEALVEFNGQKSAQQALSKTNNYMGLRPVSVKPLAYNEMQDVLSTTRHISSNFPCPRSNDQSAAEHCENDNFPMNQGSKVDPMRNVSDQMFGRDQGYFGGQMTDELTNRIDQQFEMSNQFGSKNTSSMASNQKSEMRNRQDFNNRRDTSNVLSNNKSMGLMGEYPDDRKFTSNRWNEANTEDRKDFNEMSKRGSSSYNVWQDEDNMDNRTLGGNSSLNNRSTRWSDPNETYEVPESNYSARGGLLPSPTHHDDGRDAKNVDMGNSRWDPNQRTDLRQEMVSSVRYGNNMDMMQNKIPEDRRDIISNKRPEPRTGFQSRRPESRQDFMQDINSELRPEMMQDRRSEPRHDMMQNRRSEPRKEMMPDRRPDLKQDVIQNRDRRSDPKKEMTRDRKPEPRQESMRGRRPEPRQGILEDRRPDPRPEMAHDRRPEHRQEMSQDRRQESRQDMINDRKSDRRQDGISNKRVEPKQEAMQGKKPEQRQEAGQNKKPEPRQDSAQNKKKEPKPELKSRREESKQEVEPNKKSETRQETVQNQKSDPKQEIKHKKPESKEDGTQNKRSDQRQDNAQNKRSETRKEAEQTKKPDQRQEVTLNKRPENPQNKKIEPKKEDRRSNSREEMSPNKRLDLRQEILQNNRSESSKEKPSNQPDLRQELLQNKRPDLRQEIIQSKRPERVPNNPEMWLEDNFGSFSNNDMRPNSQSEAGRIGLMGNLNSSRMGGRERPDDNDIQMRRNDPHGRGMLNPNFNNAFPAPEGPRNQMQMNERDGRRFMDQRNDMEVDSFSSENQRGIKRPLMPNPPDDFSPRFRPDDRRDPMMLCNQQQIRKDEVLQPASVERFGDPGCVVGAANVPYRAGVMEILEFFRGFNIRKENIIRRFNENGMATGDARIAFKSPHDALRAVRELNNTPILGRPVSLFQL